MGQAIAVRTDYSSGEVRRLAQRAKDAGQARRLLAIAAVRCLALSSRTTYSSRSLTARRRCGIGGAEREAELAGG